MSDGPRPRALAFAFAAALATLAAVALVRALRRPRAVNAPWPMITVDGRRRAEGCLRCHADTRGLGSAHDPAVMGCSPCHLGDPGSAEKSVAHRGMEVLSGDLATVDRTCGRVSCHPVESARVQRSLMAGAPGILAVDRFAFGESADPTPRPEDDLRTLSPAAPARSPAEDHTRRLCASCHLAARKHGPGDHGFDARGGGCTACHLAPPALRGARSGHRAEGMLHPDVSAEVSPARCRGCHARSGRISLSYEGEVELEAADPRVQGRLPDGRPLGRAPADVHAQAGLNCMDCHSERDLMGDGGDHAFAAEAVGVTCDDCHAPRERPVDPDAEAVATRLRAAWVRRGRAPLPTTARPMVTARGVPLWRTDRVTRTLWRADDGAARAVPPRSDAAHHALRGHERLDCQSCHSVWTPRCGSCHTTYDPAGRDVDHLTNAPRPGAWREVAGANGFGPPVLLVNGAGRIAPFTEGMTLTIDGLPRPVQRVLWAPLDPHTTGPARACASCHPDGPLDAVYPAAGETTRPRARTLDADERRRVAAVGRCVPCHGRYDDAVYRDFAASVGRASDRARRAGDPHATER
ncbi:MAG: hypothetical protein EPO40_37050 [Myxococcaceae bacterium]|nr:MAG: hypothetical protein EPO40_37050 [Myxococcaceae bacterium]